MEQKLETLEHWWGSSNPLNITMHFEEQSLLCSKATKQTQDQGRNLHLLNLTNMLFPPSLPHTKSCDEAAGMFHLNARFGACKIRSQNDAMTAQHLKDTKYKEFRPVDFEWAPEFLESRRS